MEAVGTSAGENETRETGPGSFDDKSAARWHERRFSAHLPQPGPRPEALGFWRRLVDAPQPFRRMLEVA